MLLIAMRTLYMEVNNNKRISDERMIQTPNNASRFVELFTVAHNFLNI